MYYLFCTCPAPIPHFFQQSKNPSYSALFPTKKAQSKDPSYSMIISTKKAQSNHLAFFPHFSNKGNTQRNHKETTLYPSTIDVHTEVLDL